MDEKMVPTASLSTLTEDGMRSTHRFPVRSRETEERLVLSQERFGERWA